MTTKDFETVSRRDYEAALERAEKAKAECRLLTSQLETCRQHSTTLREVGDQMLKDYQQTTLELERERRAAAEMRAALEKALKVVSEIADIRTESRAGWAHKAIDHVLSSDAGRDYHHADEFKPLVEVAKAAVKAHESMFEQCASNSVFNAWGKEVSVLALNEARQLADSALATARKKGLIS